MTSAMVVESSSRYCAASTGMNPFNMSPNKVIAAAFFPPMRNTFVAPGLPEPLVRGSGRRMHLQTIIAVEIEPNK